VRPADLLPVDLQSIAAKLLDDSIAKFEELGGGRNSRIFRADCESAGIVAVKFYFQDGSGGQSRLDREFAGLQFLADNQIQYLPHPIVADRARGCAIYEYIPAARLAIEEVDEECIGQVVEFVQALRDLSLRTDNRDLPMASEACFSLAAVVDNIRQRLHRLTTLPKLDEAYILLHKFLAEEFEPCLRDLIQHNNDRKKQWSIAPTEELTLRERVLSPSDFGFHNILRRHDGRLFFLDFEHFGWDDPAKLISDFLLHPHELMALEESLKIHFVDQVLSCFSSRTDSLIERLEMVYPLYALKWCMILLNEFVPIDWSRRVFSNSAAVDKIAVQMKQLDKARRMLAKSRGAIEYFPYWS
jgi:hypothetical protein